jgi:glycosyltransferase involved in cell wall biosynthesis
MKIVIDATNIGGGGGITHLQEILEPYGLKYPVILIAQQKILDYLPDYVFLTKVSHYLLNKSLFYRVFYQLFFMDKYIPKDSIVFSITGDFIGKHQPMVSMSQNMLLYERDIWKEIKQPKEILRFWLNYQKQKYSFKKAEGIIFISNYAKNYIESKLNLNNKQIIVIHHGISRRFLHEIEMQIPISHYTLSNPFKLLYVSTVHVYKNQWNVVEAIGNLRKKGYPIILNLVGEVIFKPAGKRLRNTINLVDPENEFIYCNGHLPYQEIDNIYKNSDGIIFASTCENMPNILIESMASGKPIACSNKQPMPEFIKGNAFFFDAHNVKSISSAIEEMLIDFKQREKNARRNLEEVSKYQWKTTSKDTFNFIENIFNSKLHV